MLERRICRVCGGALRDVYNFGDFYISTFVEKAEDHIGKAPLYIAECEKCSLLQLKHTAPQEVLYAREYNYRSKISEVIVNDLKNIVEEGTRYHQKGTWVDIGANDGTLLSFVKGFKRIGVEPATNLQKELIVQCDKAIEAFWEDVHIEKAEIITAIGMLYDSENPNIFVKNITEHLAKDGIFIAQLMTLWPMLRTNDLGNICHEHLEYYSYKSLVWLFEKNGLEIFRVEENGINGGSYRIYARHLKDSSIDFLEPKPDYKQFVKNILKNKRKVCDFVWLIKEHGAKIYGYGASTKGNTILQFYGLDHEVIDGIADRNPEKHGKFTVGTHIPIVSEKEAREKANYFIAMPWGFINAFMEREKEWYDKGGRFITHTPIFSVL